MLLSTDSTLEYQASVVKVPGVLTVDIRTKSPTLKSVVKVVPEPVITELLTVVVTVPVAVASPLVASDKVDHQLALP